MMKNFKRLFATLTLLATATASANSDVAISKNLFLQRAFSANIARELLMEGHVTSTDFDGFYSFFSATGVYQRAWNQSDDHGIGAFPFWSGTNQMTVGTNDGLSSLDAYQFGLGSVTNPGSITLNPIVYQGGSDFLLYFGASINDPGMFIKLKAPLAIIAINPQLTEVDATPAANYPAGALQVSTSPINDPATTMTQAFRGSQLNGQNSNGSDFLPMQFGLIDGVQKSGAQFGDIEMTLGYNFVCNEDYVFGLGLRASAPSANKPNGIYMLQPLLGRGGSWGIGTYIDGKAKLWENHTNQSIHFNLMATILHLVKTTSSIRSYDLTANGPGSKYLLVADYNGGTYQDSIQNLINISTLPTSSSLSAEGNVAISLSYISNGWAADFGYEFWGRTSETLSINGAFPENRYAVLGNQGVGQSALLPTPAPTINSNACQPLARINLSAPASTTVVTATTVTAQDSVVLATLPANRISGNTAFDIAGAEQAGASTSKLFAKGSYAWLDCHYSPHLGLAGEFEISTAANNALPQWSVALIGGLYF